MHVPSTNTTSVDRCRGFGTCMSLELGASVTVVVVYGVVMNASHYERAIIFFAARYSLNQTSMKTKNQWEFKSLSPN